MAWKDQITQPRNDVEAGNIAAESMGGEVHGKPRSPRFHRMSITAAQNGVSVSHTMKVPVKGGKTKAGTFPQGGANPSVPSSDGEGFHHHDTDVVFTHDHPMMKHVHAIHQHIAGLAGIGDTDEHGD